MGSPIVFHTAPPQPASKARMICSPQFVGGPEASQKGFGQRMPAKLVVRSDMGGLPIREHGRRRSLSISHGIHYFAAAVHAVAAGVVFGIAGAPRSAVYRDQAA